MIIVELEQGSQEWLAEKVGKASTSNFDKIITPTGKKSDQSKLYMNKLLAEWLTGEPSNGTESEWILRGTELEPEARSFYEFEKGVEVTQVGLIYKDERRLACCSPDGLIENKGGCEFKCPAPHTHVEYLLNNKLPTKYIPQVQGGMYFTGFEYWDFMSYHPSISPLLIRVERDESYIKLMDEMLEEFIDTMLEKRNKLIEMGLK